MPKPSTLPTFATGTNYPADGEPEQGTATKVVPSADALANGYRPKQKPKAQNLNYMLYWLSQWAAWAGEDKTIQIAPPAWALEPGLTWTQNPRYVFCGAVGGGEAMYPISLPVGSILKTITLAMEGDNVVDPVITVQKISAVGTVTATLATRSLTNLASGWANQLINFAADTTPWALSVVNDPPHGVYRTTGNFITEGFAVGMTVTLSGFTNAGNNSTRVISGLQADGLGMGFVSDTGMVAEASGGNERIVATPITLEAGYSYVISVDSTSTGPSIGTGALVYTPG